MKKHKITICKQIFPIKEIFIIFWGVDFKLSILLWKNNLYEIKQIELIFSFVPWMKTENKFYASKRP